MTDHAEALAKALEPSRIWFDTEFIEDGKTIDLLSIGLVRPDGATYYAECAEADHSRADDWVKANVLVHLTGETKPRAQIAREIIEFAGPKPEFWAYYADYDWVALCQLYGRMIDLPEGWPMFCRDLKQLAVDLGNPDLPKQESGEHNALADAQWNRTVHAYLATPALAGTEPAGEVVVTDQMVNEALNASIAAGVAFDLMADEGPEDVFVMRAALRAALRDQSEA